MSVSRAIVEARAASLPNQAVGDVVAAAVETELARERVLALAERASEPSASHAAQRQAVAALLGALFDRLPAHASGTFVAGVLGAVVGQLFHVLGDLTLDEISPHRVRKLIRIGAQRSRSSKRPTLAVPAHRALGAVGG